MKTILLFLLTAALAAAQPGNINSTSPTAAALAKIESAETTIQAALQSIQSNATALVAALQKAQVIQTTPSASDTAALAQAVVIAQNIAASAQAVMGNVQAATPAAAPVAGAPVITGLIADTTNLGASYDYQITASNTPTAYAVNGTLPPGITVNPTTGAITGTSTATGIWSVVISATNAAGTATALLTIGVLPD